tara:strand:+ start:5487 stop:6398 length:912 start_codon:yes stop_codon:yes gene_type:complete
MKPSCRLIIGATGFIGRSLSKTFVGEDTFFLSRNNKKEKINNNHYFIDINNKREITLFFKKLNARYKKVIIFFLAGESSVEDSIKKPEISFLKSLQGFSNVISNTSQKSKLIICSSGSIYDSRKKTFFKETDSLFPPSSYSASKFAIEGLALSYFESFGIDVRIARIFSVYGEDMKRFFIYDLIKKIKNNPNEVILNGSGKQFRDYLHVSDIVKGLKIINTKGKPGEIYNLCSGKKIELKSLANEIKKILKQERTKISWDKNNYKGLRDSWYGDNSKIKKIGFVIQDEEKTLRKTVEHIFSKV